MKLLDQTARNKTIPRLIRRAIVSLNKQMRVHKRRTMSQTHVSPIISPSPMNKISLKLRRCDSWPATGQGKLRGPLFGGQ